MRRGSDAANYRGGFSVKGENGTDLHETSKGDPQALLGLMVPSFPNFFTMYGPSTNSVPARERPCHNGRSAPLHTPPRQSWRKHSPFEFASQARRSIGHQTAGRALGGPPKFTF